MFGEIYYKMRFFILPVMVVFVMMGGFLFYDQGEAAVRPIINSLNPESVKAGSPSFVLDIKGNNFLPDAKAFFDGIAKVTRFISQNILQVDISKHDIVKPGKYEVDVRNFSGTSNELGAEFRPFFEVIAPTLDEKGLKVALFAGGGVVAVNVVRSAGLSEVSFIAGGEPPKEILRLSLKNSLDLAFAAKSAGVLKIFKEGILEQEKDVVPGIFAISLPVSETESFVRNLRFINSGGEEVFEIQVVFSQGKLTQVFSNKFILSSADIDGLTAGEGVFTVRATGLDGKFTNTSVEVVVQ